VLAGWRRLIWVTWRQHRTSLLVVLSLFGLTAAFLAVTKLDHPWHAALYFSPPTGPHRYAREDPPPIYLLALLPIVAGLILGAPLLAHEAESGTASFAWTQGTGRGTLLAAKAAPIAAALAIAGAGLGLEYGWWTGSRPFWEIWDWAVLPFNFHPLPYAGWMVFGFSLGVLLGALTRRTVPALVGTLIGYLTVFGLVNLKLRGYYLPPDHEIGGASQGFPVVNAISANGFGGIVISDGPILPNGQPVPQAELNSNAWLKAHHVLDYLAYQPGSRYVPFQFLEFGYLVALSVLMIAVSAVLIRRRRA
jgi:hypothetical protein